MQRLRTRKSLVLCGLVVLVFAALVPSLAHSLPAAILTPLWLVVPVIAVTLVRRTAARSDEQSAALLALAPLRAPPVSPVLA
jgi:hypothetical protein